MFTVLSSVDKGSFVDMLKGRKTTAMLQSTSKSPGAPTSGDTAQKVTIWYEFCLCASLRTNVAILWLLVYCMCLCGSHFFLHGHSVFLQMANRLYNVPKEFPLFGVILKQVKCLLSCCVVSVCSRVPYVHQLRVTKMVVLLDLLSINSLSFHFRSLLIK